MTPGRPKGRTAVRIISHFVAPSASAPSLCGVGVLANTSREIAVTIGRIMMANTRPMNAMVPPVMPVGPKTGSHPNLVETNDSTGAMTGRKTMSPHRP